MRQTGLLGEWASVPWFGAESYGPYVWKHVWDQWQRRNWPELLFYLVDEPGPARYGRVEAAMAKVAQFRKQYPRIKVRTTTGGATNPKVAHYYDVWIAGAVNSDVLKRAKHLKKELWFYDSGVGPVDAHTSRHLFGLWAWKTGVTGLSFWAYYDGVMEDRFGIKRKWRDSRLDLTEYTHYLNFVYPASAGPIPTMGWEAVREGVDDYRYLRELATKIAAARKAGVVETVLEPARKVLGEIQESVGIGTPGRERARASRIGGVRGRQFDRRRPEPALEPEDYDRLRYRVAKQIIRLNRAMGIDYRAAEEAGQE